MASLDVGMGMIETWFFDGITFRINRDLADKLIKAPISFYETNSKDIIMNRLSKSSDVFAICWVFFWIFEAAIRICMTLGYIFQTSPICALSLIPSGYFMYIVMKG